MGVSREKKRKMLRNTGTGDNNVNGRPTADSGFGNNVVNGILTADSGFGNNGVNGIPTADSGFGEGNVNTTQYFNIGGGVDTSAATADYASRVARPELATQEEKRQIEQRYEQMAEGIRQEAFAALNQQEQSRVQQQEQDRARVEAAINQVHREAQVVINETRGAENREARENAKGSRREKTQQADAKLNERIRAKQTSNDNTTHRNEQTPENNKTQKNKNRTFTT